MLLQAFAVHESGGQLAHKRFFFGAELCGVRRVYGGEIRVTEWIFLAIYGERAFCPIHAGEHIAVFHFIFRVATDYLPFQFEQDNADRLMHAGIKV